MKRAVVRAHWQPWIFAAALLAGATVVVLAPLSTHPADVLYDPLSNGGQADVRLTAWVLAWGTHAISAGRIADVFDANTFYPARNSLASSENLLGAQVLFAPIRLLSAGPALSLNLFTLATFVLSGLSAWWCAFRWFGMHMAGAVAGFAFAFAPWRINELGHVQLLSVMYLPLVAWASYECAVRRGPALWSLLAGACFLQAASSLYLGYMAFATALLFGAVAVSRSERRGATSLFLASAIGAAFVSLLPLALPYLASTRGDLMFGPSSLNPLRSLAYLYPPVRGGVDAGWGLWWAVPALALLGIGIEVRERRWPLVVSLVAVGIVGAWVSAGPHGRWLGVPVGWLHYGLAEIVPGWSSFRGFPRFAILAWLALSLLAAAPFGVAAGRSRASLAIRAAGALLIGGLTVSAWRVPIPVEPAPELGPERAPHEWLARHGDGVPVLHVPRIQSRVDADYMYLGTLDFSPMLNGYGGYAPAVTKALDPLIRALPARNALAAFTALGLARLVVVHTESLRPAELRAFEEAEGLLLRERLPRHAIYEVVGYEPGRSSALFRGSGATALGLPLSDLRSEDLAARATTVFGTYHVAPGGASKISFDVKNRSDVTWPGLAVDRAKLVELEVTVDVPGAKPGRTGGVGRLPYDVAPKEWARVDVRVRAPLKAGTYRVLPCMAQHGTDARRCIGRDAFELVVDRGTRPPDSRGRE